MGEISEPLTAESYSEGRKVDSTLVHH
jgi:hypothetical protein